MRKYIDYMALRQRIRSIQDETMERYLGDTALTQEQLEGKWVGLQTVMDIINEMALDNSQTVIGPERNLHVKEFLRMTDDEEEEGDDDERTGTGDT